MIVIVMGVSGSGKSTVGAELSKQLRWPFYDADDYHSRTNKQKMRMGVPLQDTDRLPWLAKLSGIILKHIELNKSMVLACSALKGSHRVLLDVHRKCHFVYLKGTFEVIQERIRKRHKHFFNPELTKSQFDALEEPQNCLVIDIGCTVKEIVATICKQLNLAHC